MNIRTNGLDEKAGAVHLLAAFAEFIPVHFYKYKEKMEELLVHCNGYFHENVRMQAAISWAQFAVGLAKRNFILGWAQRHNLAPEQVDLKQLAKNKS